MNEQVIKRSTISPPRVLALTFAVAILVGGVLLTMPWASASGETTSFLDALFTATSAVCVTGLVVRDTGTYWSPAGQMVILLLIQLGGLGIMTVSALVVVITGRRVGLQERLALREQYGGVSLTGVMVLVRYVVAIALGFQIVGALVLAATWARNLPPTRAIYLGLFHSISAFNNAGFDLFTTSLESFSGDILTNVFVTLLIIAGGLGFTVLLDIYGFIRLRSALSLHSRIVLVVSAALLAAGMMVVYVGESTNPATLGGRPPVERVLGSWFHSVTPRTAGFNTLPTPELRPVTQFFTIGLMFIGGSPGSTAGGVKTAAFAVLVLAMFTGLAGRKDLEVHHRRLNWKVVNRALSIVLIGGALVFLVTLLLLFTEGADFLTTLFEATSAFGTVGLSMGLTGDLSVPGRVIVMITMFAGRLGPLTLATAIAFRQRQTSGVRKPEDRIVLG